MQPTPAGTIPTKARPKSPIRRVVVEHVERVTPLLRRITLTGPELEGFGPPRPASHIKLHLVPPNSSWSPSDETAPRAPRRTYTPRFFDPVRRRLDVDFVLHGHGLASDWAAQAAPGHSLFFSGPGGGYEPPQGATSLILVADDTALPAAGMIIESLPAGIMPLVLAEVAGAGEQRPLSPTAPCETRWLLRDVSGKLAGDLLEASVRDLPAATAEQAHWWIACEAAAMRRIRQHLLRDKGISPSRLHTRGYWKLGETAYPDHDYGSD